MDYTSAPFARWKEIQEQVISVFEALLNQGYSIITEGTKCMFLSTSVRLFQALEAAQQEVKLDVYEGLWHVFQTSPTPETEVSLEKIRYFLHQHLHTPSFSPRSEGSQAFRDNPS